MKTKTWTTLLLFLFLCAGNVSAQKFLDKVLKGLEKTNQVLDETDKILGTDTPGNSSSGRRVAGFKIVSPHPDLEIQMKRCAASASTVVIDLLITNLGKNERLYMGSDDSRNRTIALDDNGNSYDQIYIAIGNSGLNRTCAELFPTNIPLKVRIQIQDVNENATIFKQFNLRIDGVNDPITIYNVPITRQGESSDVAPSDNSTKQNDTADILEAVPAASSLSGPEIHPEFNGIINDNEHGGYSPEVLSEILNCKTDWEKIGVIGKVKSVTEQWSSGDHAKSYNFTVDGRLNSADDIVYHYNDKKQLVSTKSKNSEKIFNYKNGILSSIQNGIFTINITNTQGVLSDFKDQKGVSLKQYNEKGQVVCRNSYESTIYKYNEKGLCIQALLFSRSMESIDDITSDFTYNEQGNIIKCIRTTISYEDIFQEGQPSKKGKQISKTSETSTYTYQYDENGNWVSLKSSKGITIKRAITYY